MKFKHTNHTFERNYPKLVRDQIPEIVGDEKRFRTIKNDKEFLNYLLKKLVEESTELQKSKDNFEEELADIFEILEMILKVKKKTQKDITRVQKEKRKERGGFQKRILMLKREGR